MVQEECYLFLGISLDKFSDNPKDLIYNIDFYNLYTEETFFHAPISYNDKEKTKFVAYAKDVDFGDWKKNNDIVIPLKKEKFEMMKSINTRNHSSLKKFLKSFGFEEYLI
jgi:hypothetical protein